MELTNYTKQRQIIRARQGKARVAVIDLPARVGDMAPQSVTVADDVIAQVIAGGGPGAMGLRHLVESKAVLASAPLPSTPRAKA